MHKITAADINSRLNNYIQNRREHVDLQVALHLIDADSILVTRTTDEKIIRIIRITPSESFENCSIAEYKKQEATKVFNLELVKTSSSIDIKTLLKYIYDDLVFENAKVLMS